MTFITRLPAAGVLFALCFTFFSCAKVGDPLPPPVRVPPPPTSVTLIQEGGRFVHLAFSLPSDDIAQVELYRACGTEGFESPLAIFAIDQTTRLPDGSLRVTDDQPQKATCRYALRLVDSRKNRSGWSQSVETSQQIPPLPPTRLRAEVFAGEILVQWDPPERSITGQPIEAPIAYLINSEVLVKEPHYRDTQFQFGEEVSYSVQAIARLQDPVILSEPGETLTLVPRDVFPPGTPQNVNAVLVGNHVQLVWDLVGDEDVQGYVVYRGSEKEHLERISTIITTNRYLDENAPSGGPLFYQVSAVDWNGNEGERSEVVSVRTNN
ncbi:MAG TPA: hypothetical protein VKZ59_08530 [Acidobacteriota bacterium]|nr:hypothetical protein [Acidobacteriota bacterium]